MLTELAIIATSTVASLLVALTVARVTLRNPGGRSDVRRLAEAASRAADAFLWRENRLIGLIAVALSAVIVASYGYRAVASDTAGDLVSAAWTVLGVLLGAVTTGMVAHLSSTIALRAARRAAAITNITSHQTVVLSIRAGSVLGLVADVTSTASVAALFALPFFLGGSLTDDPEVLGASLIEVATILPGFGVGAACAALVYQMGGATYLACADIGANLGAEQRAGIERDDARNPALVAALVGDQVGRAAGRSVDAFVLGSLGNIAAWLLGIALVIQAGNEATWGLLTLPLVVRTVGAIASTFGMLTAHAEESERAVLAVWRGQIVTCVVTVGGVAGAALWLLGPTWPSFAGAAVAGAWGFGLSAHVPRRLSARTSSREVAEASRTGAAVTVARAAGAGLAAAWVPVLGIACSLSIAWELGRQAELPAGGPLGLAVGLCAALGSGAYCLAMGVFSPISRASQGLRAAGKRVKTPDERRRQAEIDEARAEADLVAQTFFATAGPAAALFSVLAIPSASTAGAGVTLDLATPTVLYAGVLGAATVLALAGRSLGVAARGAKLATAEVERQLRGFPLEGQTLQVPSQFTPTYRLLVDQAGKVALDKVLWSVSLGVFAPVILGFALRLLYSSSGLAVQGLVAFVAVASATGLATALSVDLARAVLGAAHRANRPRGSSPGFENSAEGEALADLFGTTAAPAGLLITKTVAITSLVVAPLLF